ncbi:MAG: chemotaxis protein CheA [Campylobacteraceae bacterium]|nr:chemotaxis protein CheA [Campylobacteraceae bacterium]
MSFDISKYREMFVEEAEELFESADNILLAAENNGSLTEEEMGQLFRDVHTLKGSGASVELTLFAKYTHSVENLMDKLRNHKIEFIPEMAGSLMDALDVMKELLELECDDELTDEIFTSKTTETLAIINAYSDAKKEETKAPEVKAAAVAKKKDNITEAVGFYDDDLNSALTNKAYGIFADDDISNDTSADAFGFFDDELNESSKNAKDITIPKHEENENFGFFDEVEAISPDVVKQEVAVQTPVPSAEVVTKKEAPKEKTVTKKSAATNNIRVNLDKIDLLMNNVGDLVITNAMLTQFTSTIDDVKIRNSVLERLELLERHIRDMQDSIMSIRMVPMESIYSKFPKVVRDISKKLSKKVEFKHYGDGVEIDKAMIEGLTDPLMHIIRNSLDHGLETPEERLAAGKDEVGSIIMSAEQANGQMIITIEDNGHGINYEKVAMKALSNGLIDENTYNTMTNQEKAMLVFGAGVSTADEITDISGRGVGMDVVKTNIHKLGGAINLDTEMGRGTIITIMLPLTLAILDGLDIAVGDQKYILPLSSIVESLQPTSAMIKKIGDGTQDLLMLREEFIPVVKLHNLFGVKNTFENLEDGMLIVVKSGVQKVAISIDEFLDQHQVVVKPLDKNFRAVEGIGAATVRGDGSIGLILDILGIINAQVKVDKGSASQRAS